MNIITILNIAHEYIIMLANFDLAKPNYGTQCATQYDYRTCECLKHVKMCI